MHLKKLAYICIPVIEIIIIIYLCCFVKPSDLPNPTFNLPPYTDKIVHFTLHFALALGWIFAYIHLCVNHRKWHHLFLFCITPCIIFGAVIEIVQYKYLDGRDGDWMDLLSNILGSITALLLVQIWMMIKTKKQKQKLHSK